jgi:hypothetical protein
VSSVGRVKPKFFLQQRIWRESVAVALLNGWRASADPPGFGLLRGRLLEIAAQTYYCFGRCFGQALQQRSPLPPERTKNQVHVEGGQTSVDCKKYFMYKLWWKSGVWKVLESNRQAGKGYVWLRPGAGREKLQQSSSCVFLTKRYVGGKLERLLPARQRAARRVHRSERGKASKALL